VRALRSGRTVREQKPAIAQFDRADPRAWPVRARRGVIVQKRRWQRESNALARKGGAA